MGPLAEACTLLQQHRTTLGIGTTRNSVTNSTGKSSRLISKRIVDIFNPQQARVDPRRKSARSFGILSKVHEAKGHTTNTGSMALPHTWLSALREVEGWFRVRQWLRGSAGPQQPGTYKCAEKQEATKSIDEVEWWLQARHRTLLRAGKVEKGRGVGLVLEVR